MSELRIWDAVITAFFAVMGFFIRSKMAEIDRLSILLNKTREEVARDHITRTEYRQDMQNILEKLDKLGDKLDALMKEQSHAHQR